MKTTRQTAIGATPVTAVPSMGGSPRLVQGVRIKPDREEMVAVPGGRVYVRINGDLAAQRPPTILVHGGPGSSHWYFLNATALAAERAVILYDQLDSGRSDHPNAPSNWNLPRFVAELKAIREALGIARWHVLGTSWGSTIVIDYAADRPAELASAILSSPAVSARTWLRDTKRLIGKMPRKVRDRLMACESAGFASAECDQAAEHFYRRYVMRFDPPASVQAYKDALPESFNPNIYKHMWGPTEFHATGTLKEFDVSPQLKRLDGRRALFITGEYDEALPSTVSVFARVSRASFRVVANAAHLAMSDNPERYLSILAPWLRRHDGRT
jgi:L-proline amide hydrolase